PNTKIISDIWFGSVFRNSATEETCLILATFFCLLSLLIFLDNTSLEKKNLVADIKTRHLKKNVFSYNPLLHL
ncbi:hypothetical protein NLO05_24905, partial [Escherichia coli]|nr:hypothetical protein [Escherichia coli]